MRRGLVAVLLAATVGLIGAPSASAAVASTITIRWNATTERFHGKVSSSNAECVGHRTVKLFKVTADGPVLQGKTQTGPLGRWHIELMHAHGHYFAKTPKQTIMSVVCAADRSPTIDVM